MSESAKEQLLARIAELEQQVGKRKLGNLEFKVSEKGAVSVSGASDKAQLRAKGQQSYGIGPAATRQDATNFGLHSDVEHLAESSIYPFVEFVWNTVTDHARRFFCADDCEGSRTSPPEFPWEAPAFKLTASSAVSLPHLPRS